MERDPKLERIFIMALGEISKDKEFIVSSLTLMNTDEMRLKVLHYLYDNENATKSDVMKKMAYISVGKE